MHRSIFVLWVLLASALAACGSGGTYGSVGVGVAASSPRFVQISPGVYAVADVDEPIFYADNQYWRFSGGYWYRSPSINRGWAYAPPPRALARLDRPYAYRYRHEGGRVRVEPRRDMYGRQVIREPSDRRPVIRRHR